MEIFLTSRVMSLTGALDSYTGYCIRQRGNRFFSSRISGGTSPNDGHWRFIVICAELARRGFYIRDIHVPCLELIAALHEAGHHTAAMEVRRPMYNAEQILQLKSRFVL